MAAKVRSVRSAKRARFLAGVVTLYAVLVALGGIGAGVALGVYRRIYVQPTGLDGTPGSSTTTFPYVWAGVGVGVGAVVVATLLLLVAELTRIRAHLVLEEATAPRGTRRAAASDAVNGFQDGRTADGLPAANRLPPPPAPNGRRVLVLSEREKAELAMIPPPQLDEGWYPDPLDAASLRRWNGTQWTGEQQTIALPPR